MTGQTKETTEALAINGASSADGPKSWTDLSLQGQEAVRLQMGTLAVLGALNALARRSRLTLDEFLETEGPHVFQKIGPIPQVKDSLAIIATAFALVNEGGEPDYETLFANFDAVFRCPDGTPPQSVTLTIPHQEPLPKAA